MVQEYKREGKGSIWIIITVVLVALVILGVVVAVTAPAPESSLPSETAESVEGVAELDTVAADSLEPLIAQEDSETGDAMPEEAPEQADDGLRFTGEVLAGSRSPLLDFNQEDYERALASDRLIVLYFYANWCPICRAEFPLMQAAFDALEGYDVVGFRVNYNDNQTDSDEKELAKQFGVAYQHTKILLIDGERVLKSPEEWSYDRYLAEIAQHR